MGWWKSEHGIIGDVAADFTDEFLKKVQNAYTEFAKRPPTQGEIADLIEFVSCGIFRVNCGKTDYPFDQANKHETNVPRASEIGKQGVQGPSSNPGPGELANIDPITGDYYERGEVSVVMQQQFEEAEYKQKLREENGPK